MCFAEFIHCQRYQLWIPCTIACLDAVLPTSHKPEQAGIRVALASLHQLVVLAALGGSHVLGRVVTVHGLRLEQGKRWRRRTRNPWVLKVVFFPVHGHLWVAEIFDSQPGNTPFFRVWCVSSPPPPNHHWKTMENQHVKQMFPCPRQTFNAYSYVQCSSMFTTT